MGLTGPKLLLTCVKKALGVVCTPTDASSSELTEGIPLLGSGSRRLMRKNY
jgi:hypothetical protein